LSAKKKGITSVFPDLRMIWESIAAGLGFSVLPDYLCTEMVKTKSLTLLLKPSTPITYSASEAIANQIWLTYRKSARQSRQIVLLLELLNTM
jgi:DNA-binding transcriptional LysR family regulator